MDSRYGLSFARSLRLVDDGPYKERFVTKTCPIFFLIIMRKIVFFLLHHAFVSVALSVHYVLGLPNRRVAGEISLAISPARARVFGVLVCHGGVYGLEILLYNIYIYTLGE